MRNFASWVEGYFDYTEGLPSPHIFRKWAAISTIAAALERKVWVHSYNSNLYPGMFTVLVGPAGVGKGVSIGPAQDMFMELKDHHLAPSSVSRASLIDALHAAERRIVLPNKNPPVVSFNSLFVIANELGVLIPGYDNDFMNTLTDIWDAKRYAEHKRGKDLKISMPHPQINVLAATTPSYMNSLMPEGAWEQGFISRVMMIFSGENFYTDPFRQVDVNEKMKEALVKDLKTIGSLYGQIGFQPEAADALVKWWLAKGPPAPNHPRLSNYVSRRLAHLIKLCMVASTASSNDLIVTLEHYQTALGWLLEAERYMPDVFRSMSSGGDTRVIEDTWHYCYQTFVREKSPVFEKRVVEFVSTRTSSFNVQKILEVMVKAQILDLKHVEKVGPCYIPRMRKTEL